MDRTRGPCREIVQKEAEEDDEEEEEEGEEATLPPFDKDADSTGEVNDTMDDDDETARSDSEITRSAQDENEEGEYGTEADELTTVAAAREEDDKDTRSGADKIRSDHDEKRPDMLKIVNTILQHDTTEQRPTTPDRNDYQIDRQRNCQTTHQYTNRETVQ
jgi:hypothetical protein